MSNPAVTAQEVKKGDDTQITDEIEKDTQIDLEAGISGEREQLPGMPKEYSGWDVYNSEAKKVDTELVNDWRDSLNSLLLFAAIFAAVLTAFIIESKKLLESDPSDAMLEVMIFFTNSMANGSFTPYSRPQFEPESSSVTINCLFFASLSASLVAALASVVALQFRYAGVVWWKMSEIIAALPLLLYSSVVLFFTGLTLWMWTVHKPVGAVVAGGMGMAVLFYGVTTFLSVASVSAPFRTPLSQLIYSSVYLFFLIVDSLSHLLPIPSSQAWLRERHQRYTGAVKRDDDEVNRRHWLGVDALAWLASHLSISLDSYDRLLLLVNELRKQDERHFATPRFNEAPCQGEMRAVAILAHCYGIPTIYAIIRPREEILYYSDDKLDDYWSQYCDITRAEWLPLSPSTSLNSLFLLLRDIPLPTRDTAKHVEFTVRLSRWRNSRKPLQESRKAETSHANAPPVSSSTSAVFVHRFLKVDEEDVWFTRDDRSLYQAAAGRMVKLYVDNGDKMAPSILDTLRWRFESLLLREDGHRMDAILCLTRPLLYRNSFKKHETEYSSLHGDFTLLLARNLNSFSGAERSRRVGEVVTMTWVSSGLGYSYRAIHERQGIQSFFDANRERMGRWVAHLHRIPHSLEILEHLFLAQAEQPDIGSLWRAADSQATLSDLRLVLSGFENVIGEGVTPEQHLVLIELVCRDIELSPPGAFRADVDSYDVGFIKDLQDPCLRFIGTLAAGAEVEFAEDTSLLEDSWIRIAKHLMAHYEGTDSPTMLKLQTSAWFIIPDYMEELCWLALHEPQVLARVKRICDYPFQCREECHDIGEGHLLLHLLSHVGFFTFPLKLPALTEFPLKGHYLNGLLAVLILSDGYERLLREHMHKQGINELCTDELLEMIRILGSSQYSMLATLSSMAYGRYPDDLAGFSICVTKALDLPKDQRATSFILPLTSRAHVLIKVALGGSASERAIARREATKTIERLHTYLGRLLISGTTNCRVLSCARTTGPSSPATAWLVPYTD